MKKTLLFLILLLSTVCSSQITLENTLNSGYATRIVLENSGEKYYILNDSNSSITFFNANYTLWKTVNLSVPAYSVTIQNISETKINPDDHLEILYTTYSSSVGYQSKIINDLGTVLLTINDCYSLVLDEKDGFAPKLVAKTPTGSDIYAVPNLSIEHSYSTSEAKRIKLEYSGVKYYTFDSTNGIINLYDNDHLFWKSITLTKPDGFTFGNVNFISENDINADNLIEVGYNYYSNGVVPDREAKIINEIGNTLLTVNDGSSVGVSKLEGLPNKLIAFTFIINNSIESSGTQVFSLPNLMLEHTYEGNIFREKLEISGDKYYDALMGNYNPLNATSYQADIYNSDHSIWKTVSLTAPSENWTINNISLSETKFDTDNQLEVAYTCQSNTLDGGHYESYIIKEDGTNILTIPDAEYLYISELPNLPTKLLAGIYYNISFDNILTSTNIYNLNGVASAESFNQSIVTIAPNPTSSFLELNAPTSSIKKATILDLQGKIMEECSGENLKIIDVQNFSCGMYLLILTDENNKTSFHKFIVNAK